MGTHFQTNPIDLRDLMAKIRDGRIQLPDFQRPWKWDDERIAALLATIARDHPLGVVMTLETGGSGGLRFKPRPLAGAETVAPVAPEELLMDGQQRLTSLFQALASGKPVDTMDARRKKMRRWYYIDIERSQNQFADMEDAIVSVPEDLVYVDSSGKHHDLSDIEGECGAGLFPLRIVYDNKARGKWRRAYENLDDAHQERWDEFDGSVLENIDTYSIPVIRLTKDMRKDAVCTVFENVNTKGVQLTVFELLTASYASDDFQLPEAWAAVQAKIAQHSAVSEIDDTDFLRAICLVSTHFSRVKQPGTDPYKVPAASCKRADILNLELAEYRRWESEIVSALEWSAEFLDRQGIFDAYDLPYRSQITALAAIRTVLGAEADQRETEEKIARWFWCGVLGEQYSGALESRLPRDLEQVVAWVQGGREPASVAEASFHAARLDTMATRNSAAYKGVCGLLFKERCVDWTFSKEPIDATISTDQQVDISLVFPKAWCAKHGIETYRQNSIVNKTLLTSRTRRLMGSLAPSAYLLKLEAEAGLPGNWLDDIVSTHQIEPEHLRKDDFEAFYSARSRALLELIETAMGKHAISAEEAPESPADYQPEPELVA